MDTISLVKDDQDALNNRVKSIKKDIKSKNILIKDVGNKKPRKITGGKKNFRKPNATIYLGHIPHGFYEDEMMAYFSQFGKVISATLARSKKTGRSRGFGFVEFQNEEVAQIAADTMNNYLMYNRLLKCRYIPPEERKSRCSKIDPKNYPKKLNRIQDLKNKNAATSDLDKAKYQAKVQKKIEQFKKFFEAKGIDFSLKVGGSEMLKVRSNSSEGLATNTKKSPKEPDDQYGVLEIDESDDDIHFTTPPNVKKVIRKSCDFSMLNTPSQKKGAKAGQMKETKRKDGIQKNIRDEDIFSGKTSKKSKLGQKMLKTKKSLSVALKKKNLKKSIGGIPPEKESSPQKSLKSNQKVKKSSSIKSKIK